MNNVTQTSASQYTYSPDVTPTVESVSPTRGGTAGGTVITVTGRGFGSVADLLLPLMFWGLDVEFVMSQQQCTICDCVFVNVFVSSCVCVCVHVVQSI